MALFKITIKENYYQQELQLIKGQEFIINSRNSSPTINDGMYIKQAIELKLNILLDKEKWSNTKFLIIEILSENLENLEKELELIKVQKTETVELANFETAKNPNITNIADSFYETLAELRDYEKEVQNKIENLIYNKLSTNYNKVYFENILNFRKNLLEDKTRNEYYIHSYPCFGIKNNEPVDFLIYGQAINGGKSGFNLKDEEELFSMENVYNEIYNSNKYLKINGYTPLDEVNAYWTKSIHKENSNKDKNFKDFFPPINYMYVRSFFYNVISKFIEKYYEIENPNGWEWSKKIVMSNLYKIAPDGNNPTVLERDAQKETSSVLIKMELEEIKPKYCIVFTNLEWWTPFQESLQTKVNYTNTNSIVQSIEEYKGIKILVLQRPFRRKVNDVEDFTNEILNNLI